MATIERHIIIIINYFFIFILCGRPELILVNLLNKIRNIDEYLLFLGEEPLQLRNDNQFLFTIVPIFEKDLGNKLQLKTNYALQYLK